MYIIWLNGCGDDEQAFCKDSINNCSDLADSFVNAIGTIMYCLIKTLWSHRWQIKKQQRTGEKSLYKPEVEDSLQIRDCFVDKKTKELLTRYLAQMW